MNDQERYWLQKCIAAFRENDFDALLKDSVELERCSPDPMSAIIYRGIAYYHKRMFQQARDVLYSVYLKKMAKEKKSDPNLLYYLALCDIYTGRLGQAEDILARLEKAFPENTDYKVILFLTLNLMGQYDESSLVLGEALAKDEKATTKTLEEMLLKALENSELSGTAKVLLIEMVRKLRRG